MDEILKLLFQRLELSENAEFSADEVKEWPPGTLEMLQATGLLQETMPAAFAECPGCEEQCGEEVVVEDGRGFIYCGQRNDIGRVEVEMERLRRWQINPEGLARWLMGELGALGCLKELIPNLTWNLGYIYRNGSRYDLFLLRTYRNLTEQNILNLKTRFKECSAPVIFVPLGIPVITPLNEANLRFFSLTRICSFIQGKLVMAQKEIELVLHSRKKKSPPLTVRFPTPTGTKWEDVSIQILSKDSAKISVGGISKIFTFTELGFKDKRKGDLPDKQWEALLIFAQNKGEIRWGERGASLTIRKRIQELRKRLKSILGIEDDPFYPYKNEGAYRARFSIEDISYR